MAIVMSQRKRKIFNVEEKWHIISKLETGASNKDLAVEYGVSHSTISTIWREREKIKLLFDNNLLKMKRARTTKYTQIEEALLKWFKYQKANNFPVSGPILQKKANDFARCLGDWDFVCSSSWVQRFRARHNITCEKIYNKASVSGTITEEWLLRKWSKLCEGYKPEAIFSAAETGLFFNLTPDETLKFKAEKCSDGKMSKRRLTILVVANMTGSYKKKLLIIGKSELPWYFKNIHSLPAAYENNAKSWMTAEIFESWLRNWDAELKANNKHIVLLVDNCPMHTLVTNLQCIKLVFLSPNDSTLLLPMDQGIIRSLKVQYRKLQVLKMIQNLDNNEHKNITILDAILMISEAWEKVTPKTIANCFRNAGFSSFPDDNSDVPFVHFLATDSDMDKEDDIPLVQLAQSLIPTLSTTELVEFIDVDACITVCAPDINVEIKTEDEDQSDGYLQDEEQFTIPSLNDGLSAISVLQKIIIFNEQFHGNNYQEILSQLQHKLEISYTHLKCPK